MKRITLHISCLPFLAICLFLTACENQGRRKTDVSDFVQEVHVKTTPVLNQGNSQLCWLYAMLATIESEHLMMGDSVRLSVDYLARSYLEELASRSYFSRGKNPISMRGMCNMAIDLLQTYGAMPYDSYHAKGGISYSVLAREVRLMGQAASSFESCREMVDNLLNERIEYIPLQVYMFGAQYTPLEFAHSVCRPDEYVSLTSFTHHPFNQPFVLEVPDNIYNEHFMNMPIDTLMHYVERALRSGHPVCWEGDISDRGFSFKRGIARLVNDDEQITQERRQRDFETMQTTDDHAMELVGIAHDLKGNRYFVAKNSWGDGNLYGGFMYLSYNYVKLKTVAVYMSADVFSTDNLPDEVYWESRRQSANPHTALQF